MNDEGFEEFDKIKLSFLDLWMRDNFDRIREEVGGSCPWDVKMMAHFRYMANLGKEEK